MFPVCIGIFPYAFRNPLVGVIVTELIQPLRSVPTFADNRPVSSSCRVPWCSRHCLPHALDCLARTFAGRKASPSAVPAR